MDCARGVGGAVSAGTGGAAGRAELAGLAVLAGLAGLAVLAEFAVLKQKAPCGAFSFLGSLFVLFRSIYPRSPTARDRGHPSDFVSLVFELGVVVALPAEVARGFVDGL